MKKIPILTVAVIIALTAVGFRGVSASNAYTVKSISNVPEKQSYGQDEDLRRYMHGINIVPKSDGHYELIWSASHGKIPTDGSWNHDIFTAILDAKKPKIKSVRKLISAPEAQEPVSVSQTKNGMRMYTFEDGYHAKNEVAQRYAIYNKTGKVIKRYPQTVKDGGHSGHTASTDKQHVVFWADDWVDGGGVDNLGSGKDVLVTAYTADGKKMHTKKITTKANQREWWPMIAASKTRTMLVWQRFVNGKTYAQLMYAIYDPATNKLVKQPAVLNPKIQYYTYEVSYIPSIQSYVVSGTDSNKKGFLYTVNEKGKLTASKRNLKAFVREAKPATKQREKTAELMYPTAPTGFAIFNVKANRIQPKATIKDTYKWQYGGTIGFYTKTNDVYFASLSKKGIVEKIVKQKR